MDELSDNKGYKLEQDYVKSTYDRIAEDFSITRYKKWPKVDAFLQSLSQSSLLLDIGCGNGKYLDNSNTFNIGCDLSLNLLKICKNKGFEVVLCDMSRLPFRQEIFDSVICVAALHHIVTSSRRQNCLKDIVELMAPKDSKCLVQVWSFEQQLEKDNPYLKKQVNTLDLPPEDRVPKQFEVNSEIKLPIHMNRTPFVGQDVLVPFHAKSSVSSNQALKHEKDSSSSPSLRYYHVFKQGELDAMFKKIPAISILQSYYDRGNWCVVIGKAIESKKSESL